MIIVVIFMALLHHKSGTAGLNCKKELKFSIYEIHCY